jgi:hypothetical protein
MTDQTKTILLSAAVVAGVYILVEFYAKPGIGKRFGVSVK